MINPTHIPSLPSELSHTYTNHCHLSPILIHLFITSLQEAYEAIETHSEVDGWHFEVNMDLGLKSIYSSYVSALGAFWPALQVTPLF